MRQSAAMTIDFNEEEEKAEDLQRFRCNTGSNMIDENFSQLKNYSEPRVSIFRGIPMYQSENQQIVHN
jgi:hypothetical protein